MVKEKTARQTIVRRAANICVAVGKFMFDGRQMKSNMSIGKITLEQAVVQRYYKSDAKARKPASFYDEMYGFGKINGKCFVVSWKCCTFA